MIVNHVGQRVRGLAAAQAFYEALGFTFAKRLSVPDDPTHRLVGVTPPCGLEVVYLTNGAFVLELMAFTAHDTPPNERVMTDGGLTHLSIGVEDLAAAKDVVVAAGGSIVEGSDVGMACMVRDPDGQLVELLDLRFRPVAP